MADRIDIHIGVQIAGHQPLNDQRGVCLTQRLERVGIVHLACAHAAAARPRLNKHGKRKLSGCNGSHCRGVIAPRIRRRNTMRGKKLRHPELIEAQLRRLRIGCKHLYTDLLEALAVLSQQRDLRIDQRRDSVDLFLAANGQDLFDILSSAYLKQPALRRNLPEIVGIAQGREEAVALVQQILEETLQETGAADVKAYLRKHRQKKE